MIQDTIYWLGVAVFMATSTWYFFFFLRGKIMLNPSAYFILAQTAMFAGSYVLLDLYNPIDQDHYLQMILTQLIFIGTSVMCHYFAPVKAAEWYSQPVDPKLSRLGLIIVYSVLGVSLALSFYFFASHGGNVFLQGLAARNTGDSSFNADTARRGFEDSSDSMLRAGYALQFRDYMAPPLVALLFVIGKLTRNRPLTWFAIFLSPVAIICALGTGQRAGFFDAVICVALFCAASFPKEQAKRALIFTVLVGLVFFGLGTIALGRHGMNGNSVGVNGDNGPLAEGLQRFTQSNQESSVEAFRFAEMHPFGQGTVFGDLLGLLPSSIADKPTHSLSSSTFEVMYGSTDGTSPGSIWTHIRYDFGLYATLLYAVLLAILFHAVYRKMLSGSRSVVRILMYSGIATTFGTWIAGGLDSPFDHGIVAYLFLGWLLSKGVETAGKKATLYMQPKALPS